MNREIAKTLLRRANNLLCRKEKRKTRIDRMGLRSDTVSAASQAAEDSSGDLRWLHEAAPGFALDGCKISVIYEPKDFYKALREQCRAARHRITLASLYLGTGPLEKDLVQAVNESVQNGDGKLKLTVLLDYMRATRGKENSLSTLRPLLGEKSRGNDDNNEDACKIFLYHTPKLRGLLKKLIPRRFNELVGLQHMKLYIFDDTLIISGANLSNDYFTNRQDRYLLIKDCKELCDFYDELVGLIGKLSFRLLPGKAEPVLPNGQLDPLTCCRDEFSRVVASGVRSLFQREWERGASSQEKESTDTWIFPLVEMGQLELHHDSRVTRRILETAPAGSTLRLATGYFNLTTEYTDAILRFSRATCHLLTAHPTANGFFGAKGVARGIPAAYTTMEKSFYEQAQKIPQSRDRVNLWEFVREGWTYHAKGLWYTLPGRDEPSLTLIGSSNFGYRSVNRDLESQVAILTKNCQLQKSLRIEYERLFDRSNLISKQTFARRDRIAPTWVCAIVFFFRYYF